MASSTALTTSNLPTIRAQIAEWNAQRPDTKDFRVALADLKPLPKEESKDILVAFRTRPPLENEAEDKFRGADEDKGPEFCAGVTVTSAEPGEFFAHVPGMKWNGPTLTHKSYQADLAFGPDVGNEEVYQRTVAVNDIISLAIFGGVGCILAYGQTGSGKTFTMESIEQRIARDIFAKAASIGERLLKSASEEKQQTTRPEDVFAFNVTFLELLGKRASDLLEVVEDENKARKEVPIREDKVGNIRPSLVSTTVHNTEELKALISRALSHRRTSATLRNATSSRSHALLTITVKNTLAPYAEEGQLILVDLAGSERYDDSKEHDKKRMDEARENNKSLMNLKECVRAKARMAVEDGFVHIPWRANKLTMLLKAIFDVECRQPSKAIIIAHVSPHIQDSVHSTNTLSYAAPFKTNLPKPHGPAPYDPKDPRTWDRDATVAWLTIQFTELAMKSRLAEWKVKARRAALNGKKLKPLDESTAELGVDVAKICPPGASGRSLAMLYTMQFAELCVAARQGEAVSREDVQARAVDVIGRLFYLVITAKSRTRNEIMHSRQWLAREELYGKAPREDDHNEEIERAKLFLGVEWHVPVHVAKKQCEDAGEEWTRERYREVIAPLLERYRAYKQLQPDEQKAMEEAMLEQPQEYS
ncbi:Kinesin-like protein [Mycena kentingensis (nom. inval.)]|nr:Kinesin-like protein [Mycena kentingensis (nom. inval.)]